MCSGGSRVGAEAGPVRPTVDPADIRGLGTTLLVSVERLPRSRHESRRVPSPNALEGYAKPGPRLCSDPGASRFGSRRDGHLLGDGPHEGEELAGDRGDRDVGVLAAGGKPAKAFAQTQLGLPADVLGDLGQFVDATLDVDGDLGRIAVGPGAFDQSASSATVTNPACR